MSTSVTKFFQNRITPPSDINSSEWKTGQLYSHYDRVKDYVNTFHIPCIFEYTDETCSHCKKTANAFNTPTYQEFIKNSPYIFYAGWTNDTYKYDKEGGSAESFCHNNKGYWEKGKWVPDAEITTRPAIALYWKKEDGTTLIKRYQGEKLINQYSADKTEGWTPGARTAIQRITEFFKDYEQMREKEDESGNPYKTGIWYKNENAKDMVDWCVANNKPFFVWRGDVLEDENGLFVSQSCYSCYSWWLDVVGTITFRNYMKYSGIYFAWYDKSAYETKLVTEFKEMYKGFSGSIPGYEPSYILKYKDKISYKDGQCPCSSASEFIELLQTYYDPKNPYHKVKFYDENGTKISSNYYVGDGEDAIIPGFYYPDKGNSIWYGFDPSHIDVKQDLSCKVKLYEPEPVNTIFKQKGDAFSIFSQNMIDNHNRNVEVKKNKFHADLEKVQKKAEEEGVPMVAIWSFEGAKLDQSVACSHCELLTKGLISNTFRQFLNNSNIYWYYGCLNTGWIKTEKDFSEEELKKLIKQYGSYDKIPYEYKYGPSSDGKEGYHGSSFYMVGGADPYKTWPFIRIYWKKNGVVIVDKQMSGGYFSGEFGNNYFQCKTPDGTVRTEKEKFLYSEDYGDDPLAYDNERYWSNPYGRYMRYLLSNPLNGILKDFYYKRSEEIYHSVTFYDKNGNVLSKQNILDGKDASPPDPPEISGMKFEKWKPDYKQVKTNLSCYPVYVEKSLDNPRIVTEINYITTRFQY